MLTAAKAGDAHLAALKQIAMMVQQQALTLTYNDVLLLMAGCFFIGPAADVAAGQARVGRGGGGALTAMQAKKPPAAQADVPNTKGERRGGLPD